MNIENGWAKHVEKDKKIREEVEIEKMLVGIDELFPKYSRLKFVVSGSDYPREREALKKSASFFIGHPEHVKWLKIYLEESKAKMKAVVPGGDLSILSDMNKWREGFPEKDLIIKTAREIRNGFLEKDFEEEPTKIS
ncbi:MAG TPA: hypothetical protein VK675_02335 [Candidatus Paceibacterota bacterium]|nr:hypothetical protein [Candidatus Paceibacterota bacterium]